MHQTSLARTGASEGRGTSTYWGIEIFNISTHERTRIPVCEIFKGQLVTLDMVTSQVKLLNEVCGIHGRTMEKLPKGARKLVFKVLTMQ